MRFQWILPLACMCFVLGARAVDFPIPESVRSWDAPEFATNGIRASWIEGVPWRGRETRFFAYYALPPGATSAKKVPGIVLVHGGHGTAYWSWVKTWNARGYAAIAMDNCGGVPGANKNMSKHPRHAWSGPNGWGGFSDTSLPPEDQWPYHAVECVIRSHTFLRALPEVDTARIGVTGISWGGYLTAIVCGVDARFAFAAPVYGCGNLRAHSVWSPNIGVAWDMLWDPVQYAAHCRIPTLWCTGTNDHFFPLDSFAKTALATQHPLFSVKIRMPHGHPPYGDPPEIAAFADSIVRETSRLDTHQISSCEWIYTSSTNENWEARGFERSDTPPAKATIAFLNVRTAGGLVLSKLEPTSFSPPRAVNDTSQRHPMEE